VGATGFGWLPPFLKMSTILEATLVLFLLQTSITIGIFTYTHLWEWREKTEEERETQKQINNQFDWEN